MSPIKRSTFESFKAWMKNLKIKIILTCSSCVCSPNYEPPEDKPH